MVAVYGCQHLLQRTIVKIALKVGHIFLVAYAAVQLVDVWEDLVVRELAIGQGKDYHCQAHRVLLLEAPLHSH